MKPLTLISVLLLMLSLTLTVGADSHLAPLTGLKTITAFVTIDDDTHTLDMQSYQTRFELKLREAGITVNNSGTGVFTVTIHVVSMQSIGIFAVCVNTSLNENCTLTRSPSQNAVVSTWQNGYTSIAGQQRIKDAVDDGLNSELDTFCNDYLKDNPPASSNGSVTSSSMPPPTSATAPSSIH